MSEPRTFRFVKIVAVQPEGPDLELSVDSLECSVCGDPPTSVRRWRDSDRWAIICGVCDRLISEQDE